MKNGNRFILILYFLALFYSVTAIAHAQLLPGIQTYSLEILRSETHRQFLRDDITRYQYADNLWDHVRREFTLPHHEDSIEVQQQIEWFLSHPQFVVTAINRSEPYLYFIYEQSVKQHLPAELILLPIIESAYNPFAISPVGAAGIWQMMPNTALGYGIKQDGWYDGRRDVIASTEAALNHLNYLQNFFGGNWLLAIAAYDTGEGTVLNAIRKNIHEGKHTDFWSLNLSQETKVYVPRLLALAIIVSNPEKYALRLPAIHFAPYLAQINVPVAIDLKQAGLLAGLSFKALLQLNPGFNHISSNPKGPFKLVIPLQNVTTFSSNFASFHGSHHLPQKDFLISSNLNFRDQITKNLSSTRPVSEKNSAARMLQRNVLVKENAYHLQPGDTIYMSRPQDTLEKIAHHFHVDTQSILAANSHDTIATFHAGSSMIIPTHQLDISEIKPYHPQSKVNPGDTIYLVQDGDTIALIAAKFKTTSPAIRIANMLANNDVHSGDQLLIPKQL